MFEKDEYVVYGNNGICQIADITHMEMSGVDKNQLYYVLIPQGVRDSKLYAPVDNVRVRMRKVLSKEEAEQLIENVKNIEHIEVKDDKQREEIYKELMGQGEPQGWIKVIKTLYVRKQERLSAGKKITNTDEKYLRMAENQLYSELGFALGIEKNSVEQHIIQQVESV